MASFQGRTELENERMDNRIKTICEDLKQLEKKKFPSKTRRTITQAIWCFEDLSQYLCLDKVSDLDGTVQDDALEDTLEGDLEDQLILDESEVAVRNPRQTEMASSDLFERKNPSELSKLRFNEKSSSFKKSQTESSKSKDVHAPESVGADQLHDQYQHRYGQEQQEPHQPRNKTQAKKVKAYESVSEPVSQHHYRHKHHDQQEQQLPRNKTTAKKVKPYESVSEQVGQLRNQYQHHYRQEQQEPHQPRNKTPTKKVKAHESVSEQVDKLHNRQQHHDQQEQQEQQLPRNKTPAKKVKAHESVSEQVDQRHYQPEKQEQQFPRNKTPAKKVEDDKDKSVKKEEENMATRDLLRDAISKNMKFFLEGNTLKVRSQDSTEKLTKKDSSKHTPTVRFRTNHNDERVSRK